MRLATITATLVGLCGPSFAQDCGPDTPCEIDGGSYHLRLPEGTGPFPVLLWFHGHRGNGASIHRGGGPHWIWHVFMLGAFLPVGPWHGYWPARLAKNSQVWSALPALYAIQTQPIAPALMVCLSCRFMALQTAKSHLKVAVLAIGIKAASGKHWTAPEMRTAVDQTPM